MNEVKKWQSVGGGCGVVLVQVVIPQIHARQMQYYNIDPAPQIKDHCKICQRKVKNERKDFI
jgi:hypothetical protein